MPGTPAFIFSGPLIPLRLLPHSETKDGATNVGGRTLASGLESGRGMADGWDRNERMGP